MLLLIRLLIAVLCAAAAATTWSQTSPRFDILEFVVEGDSVLGAPAIERAVYPFLGLQRSAADAEGARKALEQAYQDAGFLSVSVVLPPQRVDNAGGEVRLQVVQATVDKLRVTGAEFHLPSKIREGLPSLQPGSVPNFPEMQLELGELARASADREITPIIAAGDRPGTMDVELKVQDSRPLHGSLELNNKQSENTRAGRLEADLRYNNLFQRGHSLGFGWFYSPSQPDRADIRTVNYGLPLGGSGDRLTLSLQHSDSNTPTPLGGSTVSRGDTWRLRWRDELTPRDGLPQQALSWGMNLRDLQDSNRNVAGFDTPAPTVRYPSFVAGYSMDMLDLAGNGGRSSSSLLAELTFGLRGTGQRNVDCYGLVKDQFACKREGARPDFQVLSLTLSHRQPLGAGWLLGGRLQLQLTDAPLIPDEQASYGGVDSVRGFYQGALAADRGGALRLELMAPGWTLLPQLNLHGVAFADYAAGGRLSPLPGEDVNANIASTGLGLRAESNFGLQATLWWAHVLRGSGRSQRWDLSLRQAF